MSARFRLFVRLSVLACVVAALWVPSLAAQELRGQIVGVATDSTGAALPGVVVTVTAPGLVQPQVTTTTEDGSYRFPSLPLATTSSSSSCQDSKRFAGRASA